MVTIDSMGAAISPPTGAVTPRPPRSRIPSRPGGSSGALSALQWKTIGVAWVLTAVGAAAELSGAVPAAAAPLVGVVIAATFALSFLHRFWPTLVALLVLRPTLDVFKDPEVSGGLDVTQLVGFVFMGAATVWLVARIASGTFRRPATPTIAFAAFAAAAAVATLGAEAPLVAVQSAVKVVSAVLMLAVLEQALGDEPGRLRTVVTAALWSVVIPLVGGLYQYIRGPELGDWVDLGRISSTFIHPNALATYLMFIGLLALAVRPAFDGATRLAVTAAGIATLPLLYLTLARSAWAGVIVGLIVIAWNVNRRLLWLLPLGLVVMLALPTTRARLADLTKEDDATQRGNANSLSWRVEYWGDVAPMFLESPVIGVGPDMVRETHPDHFEPHNTLLQSLVEFGIMGCAAFVWFFIAAIGALRTAWNRGTTLLSRRVGLAGLAMVAGYLTQSPVENLVFQLVLWWYLVIPIAAATVVTSAGSAHELR